MSNWKWKGVNLHEGNYWKLWTLLNTFNQARNQLGTPGGAKSFVRGAQIFKLQYVQHIFQSEKMAFQPLVTTPSYEPVFNAEIGSVQVWKHFVS